MDAMTRAALITLTQELGLLSTLSIGLKMLIKTLREDPMHVLDPTTEAQEQKSREQLRPAVLLYRLLLRMTPRDEALRVTALVVQSSGRAFLKSVLGDLDLKTLIDSEEREVLLRKRLQQIPNATFSLRFEGDSLHFTVSACRFVGLCHALGHPELAALFCSVDDAFFGHDLQGVTLHRETTIAQGGHHCPFVFTLHKED